MNEGLKYSSFNINFTKPDIWKRPTRERWMKKGLSYKDHMREIEEFESIKDGSKKEICENITKQIDISNSKNELNMRLDEVLGYYGKAVIPTEDFDPEFLMKKTNRNTLSKKLQPWCKNLVHNIPEVIDSTPYKLLEGKFKDVPAFVVLAGPSLKNNREKLKRAKGKSVIICVDTSLRPLLDIGVVPDICVTHDANPNGAKFFLSGDHEANALNISFNDMNEQQLATAYAVILNDKKRLDYKYDTVGLFVNYCHPLTLLAWNGRGKRFYTVLDPSLPVYQMMAACTNYKLDDGNLKPEDKGGIVGGSSVGHVAAYAAVMMGCSPVSFLGLDLSYPEGKTYVEGASNQKDMSKQKLIELDDLSGNKVKTNISMLSYKFVLERTLPQIITQTGIKFYNCTENASGGAAGVLEVGAEPKSLDWVIENKCTQDRSEVLKKWLNKD